MMLRFLWPAALAVALTAACRPAAGTLSAQDVSAIDALRERYAEAVQAGDAAGTAALYTEDAVEMPPDQPAVEGRAEIQRRLDETMAGVTALTLRGMETTGRAGLAYDRGTYSITVQVPDLPEPVTETGKFITIVEKQADGSWLIRRLIWNRDTPAPAMPAAPES